ncbi:transcriptional regulatory protein [Apiospora aurea]|uniref:Transcriptional regulatory protein n=1 Tax=Apiospora aurea TaxID=335848 RepID=A0ABR1PRG8_9PEZI
MPLPPPRAAAASSSSPNAPRPFSTTPARLSGHNKWSKIKHDKGRLDAKKSAQRGLLSKDIALATRLYGPDPKFNAALVNAVAVARKAGVPKANIDAAIARGQGRSSTGASLETVTLEAMLGGGGDGAVSLVIEILTDNRNRALHDVRGIIKKHNAILTPTTFLFERAGRTVLKVGGGGDDDKDVAAGENRDDFDDVMMQAIEAGADDVEDIGDGMFVVWTPPTLTHKAAQALNLGGLKAQIVESDIVWTPSQEKVRLPDAESAQAFSDFLDAVRDYNDVQGVYANVEQGDVAQEVWDAIEENLDS